MNTRARANNLRRIDRRSFLAASAAACACGRNLQRVHAESAEPSVQPDRIRGLLLGSVIGDALGGPIEFQESAKVADHVLNCRAWPDDRQVTSDSLREFGASLNLISYRHFRPKPEPYGQWQANAPAGTITDDTRHKMVLLNALRTARTANRLPLTRDDLARAYLEFPTTPPIASRPLYAVLCEESNREFAKAAHWVLGNRDLSQAAPPDRIWGGVPTCCGQMTMPPLAAVYAGRPEAAYRATYELSFFDVGAAKDINASITAGLSAALVRPQPTNAASRRDAWQAVIAAMRTTDPYRYADVPFVERPTVAWLNFASDAAQRARRSPKRLYEILLREGRVKYFWESHFILALVFATIEFCDYDPLAAMAMILDFGHDTDSGTQLLGAFAGALHGPHRFPAKLQDPVIMQLASDYDQSLDEWVHLLVDLEASKLPVD